MIRKGFEKDLDAIEGIYDRIHTEEEEGRTVIGWIRDVYPVRATAQAALAAGELFVEELEGEVTAAARINREQVPVYRDVDWEFQAPDEQVMVMHTLVVDPAKKGCGSGTRFVQFYEEYARQQGCTCLRIDTNERNMTARKLYHKLGYREAGTMPCVFNGIPGVQLVCLEKQVM